jgi:hypothetical protein
VRLRSLPQTVSACLAPYRQCFPCQQAQHFNVWCWLLVSLLLAGSGRLKELTRWMPTRLAYWTTLRFIRAQVWDEQALLDLMVGDLLVKLSPPKDGVLHLIFRYHAHGKDGPTTTAGLYQQDREIRPLYFWPHRFVTRRAMGAVPRTARRARH